MISFPKKLSESLHLRLRENTLRKLSNTLGLVDFASNDYLGFASNEEIYDGADSIMKDFRQNGTTGSRLLSGNHILYERLEERLQTLYNLSALVFNSGYSANLGLLSSVPKKGDLILYDEYVHASLREGIMLSRANSYKFSHNNLSHLQRLYEKNSDLYNTVYVVVESVYSMDGDSPDLLGFAGYCSENGLYLIVDEAHALGVFGLGLVSELKLSERVFASIITFGKALGCHGAAVLGSPALKDYLINFARSFIYTTALPPHSLATILVAYDILQKSNAEQKLKHRIDHFRELIIQYGMSDNFINSRSAVQVFLVNDPSLTKDIACDIQKAGYDVRPILYPTVPHGKERLRFSLHSYNSMDDICKVLTILSNMVVS